MAEARSSSARALLVRFWPWVAPHQRLVWLALAMIPIVAALSALRPLLVKHAVDVSIPGGDLDELTFVASLFVGAALIEFALGAIEVYSLQRAGHATISDLRRDIFRHTLALPAKYFDKTPIGSLLSRTTSDVEALGETLSFGVFQIVADVAMIVSILIAMTWLSPLLTVVTLSMTPLLVIVVRFFSQRLRGLQLEVRKAMAVRTGYLTEQLGGIAVVQLFGREEAAQTTFSRLGLRFLRATKTANVFDAALYSIMDGISALAIAVILWTASPWVIGEAGGGVLTLGVLFAFVDYVQRIFVPIREFSGKLATIQRAAASLERIYQLFDEPAEPRGRPDTAQLLARWQGGLRVSDLRFGYGTDDEVLRGVDLDVQPGQVVAVVGRTGSGKSTLGRVLGRFYEGYRGSVELILADGQAVDLRELDPRDLRRHLLLMQQDVFLFDDDLRFNATLGEVDVEPGELRGALDAVRLGALLDARGGLALQVGERGRNLSAGEAQLLAFARVAIRAPKLLILDEASARIDSQTEQLVQQAIADVVRGRTVLVIAHRLSTIRHADAILVMSEGRVVERGTHDELIAHGGLYADMVVRDFQRRDG